MQRNLNVEPDERNPPTPKLMAELWERAGGFESLNTVPINRYGIPENTAEPEELRYAEILSELKEIKSIVSGSTHGRTGPDKTEGSADPAAESEPQQEAPVNPVVVGVRAIVEGHSGSTKSPDNATKAVRKKKRIVD